MGSRLSDPVWISKKLSTRWVLTFSIALSFCQRVSSQCPQFSQDANVTIQEGTVCYLSTSPPRLRSLDVRGSIVIHKADPSVELDVWRLTVNATGQISANGQGYSVDEGEGRGTSDESGGSYGGRGGHASGVFLSEGNAKPYGSPTHPSKYGSPGGGDQPGSGGGAIIIRNAEFVQIDGVVSADGADATSGYSGGGSGGSVFVQTNHFNGTGLVTANGGRPTETGGGGSGGRISVLREKGSFSGMLSAFGGISEGENNKLVDPSPYSPSSVSVGQYQTVTLPQISYVTAIDIRGCATYDDCKHNRNDRPQYVSEYYVMVDDGDGVFKDHVMTPGGRRLLFPGNSDGSGIVTNYFRSPILAKQLRVVPTKYYQWKFMDLKIYGYEKMTQTYRIMPKRAKGVAVNIRSAGAVTVKVSRPTSAPRKKTGVVAKPKNKTVVQYQPPKVKKTRKGTTTTITKRVTQTVTVKKATS